VRSGITHPAMLWGGPDPEMRGFPDGRPPLAPPACGGMDSDSRLANLITIAAAVIVTGAGTILILVV